MVDTHTLSGNFPALIGGQPQRISAAVRTNSADGGWVNPADNTIVLGGAAIRISPTGTFSVELPTSTGTGLAYEVVVTYIDPEKARRRGQDGQSSWSSGEFQLTADANLADLANDSTLRVNPSMAAQLAGRIDGYEDHDDVTGAVTFDGPVAAHWFDATGPTTITLDGYDEGQVVTLICFTGAANVTVNNAGDVALTDGTAWSATLARGVWVAGGGGGEPAVPDSTPPTAITDLTADGSDGQIVLDWSASTDSESPVHYRYRVFLTASGSTGVPWINTDASTATIPGLDPGAYTAQAYAYSQGGSTAFDTVTTNVVPPSEGWDNTHLRGHWDASTLAGGSGTAISAWEDLSGTADLAQADGSSRPTVQPAVLNGMTIARFDNTNDFLQSAARVTANQTIVLLRKLAGTGNSCQMWNGCLDGNDPEGAGPLVFSGNQAIFMRGVGVPSDGAADTSWHRCIVRVGASIASMHVDGVQVINDGGGMIPVSSDSVLRVGAAGNGFGSSPEYLSGGMDLAEAMIFDAILSADDIAAIDEYLVTKWGL